MPGARIDPMLTFLRRKLLETFFVMLAASFILFGLTHLIPGDPIRALFGFVPPSPEVAAALRERYGLDDPFIIQYLKYMRNAFSGDFGFSTRGPMVGDVIRTSLPGSLRLLGIALGSQVVLGVGAGVVAVLRSRSFARTLIRISTMVLLAIPVFVLGYVLQAVFGARLRWLPLGVTGWKAYVLPSIALGATVTAVVARLTASELESRLHQPFIKFAEAKGIRRSRVVAVHALRTASVPIVTLVAASVSQLVAGVLMVEQVFGLPGLGSVVFNAVRWKDHNVLAGTLAVVVFFVVIANLLADLLYGWLDPRVRSGGGRPGAPV